MKQGHRTLLGFDFGTRRIGIAVGQDLTATAAALTTVSTRHGKPGWDAIDQIVAQWRPELLVVGLPVHMDGSEHERTDAARHFGNQLRERYNLPVEWVDERLTSEEAEHLLRERGIQAPQNAREKSLVDMMAAQLILQSWLDGHRSEPADNSTGPQ